MAWFTIIGGLTYASWLLPIRRTPTVREEMTRSTAETFWLGRRHKDCYINRLPAELIQEILLEIVISTPAAFARETMETLSLVQRSWSTNTMHIMYTSINFRPKRFPHARRMLDHLKTKLAINPPGIDHGYVPCRTLSLNVRLPQNAIGTWWNPLYQELLTLVSHSLCTLTIRGTEDLFLPVVYPFIDDTQPFIILPYTFPELRELRILDVNYKSIISLLLAVKPAPSRLVIHHDFDLQEERNLLSLSTSAFGPHSRGALHPSRAGGSPLHLYIDRRGNMIDFLQVLIKDGLPDPMIEGGTVGVDIWLREGFGVPQALDDLLRLKSWRPFIEWDASEVVPKASSSG